MRARPKSIRSGARHYSFNPLSGQTPIRLISVPLWRSWREAEAAHWRRSSDLRALGVPHHPTVRLRRLRRDACTAALLACSSFVQNCAALRRSPSSVLAVHACDAIDMPAVVRVVGQPLCDATDAWHAGMPLPARPHALRKTHSQAACRAGRRWGGARLPTSPRCSCWRRVAWTCKRLGRSAAARQHGATCSGASRRRMQAVCLGLHAGAWGCMRGSMGLQAG